MHPFLSSSVFYAPSDYLVMHVFPESGYTGIGDNMKDDRQMLSSILNTAQIGQINIQKILDTSMRPALRKALQTQLQEYSSIEADSYILASQRGWELREVQPGKRFAAGIRTHMKLRHGNSDSAIADMIIQENTRAMIDGLKDLHQYQQPNSQVSVLSQRLLDCETANIRQMQPFL